MHSKDGKSIWIITFGKETESNTRFNTFYAYKIDETGVNTTPVISSLTSINLYNKGAIKASPNGKFLLLSNLDSAMLTDFDNETGKINKRQVVGIRHGEGLASISSRPKSYGVEFSKDSKYFYIESIDDGDNIIFQYNTDNIKKRQEVHVSKNPKNYMQLAKDGNIYVTTAESEKIGGNYLSMITPPKDSTETLATYKENVLNLNGKKSKLGLPNFIQSYFRTRIITESGCLNNNTLFEVDTYSDITAASWNFGDGNSSTEITPKHIYSSPGFYTVTCTITINKRQIYVSKEIEIYVPENFTITNKNIIQCDIDNDGTDFFNLTSIKYNIEEADKILKMKFYTSLPNAQDGNDEIENLTNYESTGRKEIFVRIYNDKGCFVIKNFFIESTFVKLGTVKDIFTCSISELGTTENIGLFNLALKKSDIRKNLTLATDVKIRFYPDSHSAQVNKDELEDDFTSKSTLIWVRVDTALGCGGIESFNVVVNPKPKINLKETYTICYNIDLQVPIILNAGGDNDRFEWTNTAGDVVSTNQNFTLKTAGNFTLKAYKTTNSVECSTTKTFEVISPDAPFFLDVIVNTENEINNTVEVLVEGNSTYQFSLDNINFYDNATSYTFENVIPGVKTIYVRDINNCEAPIQQNVSIIGFPKFFTPNGDGKNDYWKVKGVDSNLFKSINVRIIDRYGKSIGEITDLDSLGWDGRFNGKLLISNTYWFVAEILDINNNLIKKIGSFSLIRN